MVRQDSRSAPPSDAALRDELGPAHVAYRALLDAYPDTHPEWKWYGVRNGWTLKLLDGKRNLCFIKPGDGAFIVAFTLGHDAVNRALESDLSTDVLHQIATGPAYPEGRGVRLRIETEHELEPVHTLIRLKRGGGRQSGAPRHPRKKAARRPPSPAGPYPPAPRQDRSPPAHRRGRSPG